MAVNSFLPANAEKLAAWLQNYNTIATANQLQLGLSDAELLADTNNLANIVQSINTAKTAAAAAKAATKAQTGNHAIAVAAVRKQNKRIQVQPGVPDNLLLELGLPVHQKVTIYLTKQRVRGVEKAGAIRLS